MLGDGQIPGGRFLFGRVMDVQIQFENKSKRGFDNSKNE